MVRLALAICFCVTGCSASATQQSAAAYNEEHKHGDDHEHAGKWGNLTKDQRTDHMSDVVLPTMSKLFAAVDKKYTKMECETCHGKSGPDRGWEMPNPELDRLDPTDGFKNELEKHPIMTQFMMNTVVPKMAELTWHEPYNMKGGKGFSCWKCHLKK